MYEKVRPFLFKLNAEWAHRVGTGAARLVQQINPGIVEAAYRFAHPALYQSRWGLNFTNPVGLAAGFDKNARLVRFWESLGFGFVEVGSVSAYPAKGNPRPRAFRLPEDRALINRMGLNNDGAEKIAARLRKAREHVMFPVGVSLAKTHDPNIVGQDAIDDFRLSFRRLAPLASYIALNVSCPNTADGKTFEDPEAFAPLLQAIFDERKEMHLKVPILVKLSPPLSDRVVYDSIVEELVSLSLEYGVAGFIAANTTSDREGLRTSPARLDRIGRGGLSGAPIRQRATQLVRYLYRKTHGRVPIIGVGGVDSAETAYEKIRAGASLVQVYTGFVYEGPGLVRRINEGLIRLFEENGHASVKDALGRDT